MGLVTQILEDGRDISRTDRARLMVALSAVEYILLQFDDNASMDEDIDRLTGPGRRLLDARALFRDGGDTLEEAYVIDLLCNVFHFLDASELLPLRDRVTELAALTGDPLIEGLATLTQKGIGDETSSYRELFLQSGPLIESALRSFREAGNMTLIAYCLYNLGELAYDDDELDTAVTLTLESTSICREIRHDSLLSGNLLNLAKFSVIHGDVQHADVYLAECIRRTRVVGASVSNSGFVALIAAKIWLTRGDVARTAELVGAVKHFDLERTTRNAFMGRADRRNLDALLESLHERLGAEFEDSLRKGENLSPEHVLDLAAGRRAPSP